MFVSDVVCDEVGFCDDVCYQAGDEYPLPEGDCFCVRVFEAGGELSSENCGAVFSKPSKDEGGEGFDGDFSRVSADEVCGFFADFCAVELCFDFYQERGAACFLYCFGKVRDGFFCVEERDCFQFRVGDV